MVDYFYTPESGFRSGEWLGLVMLLAAATVSMLAVVSLAVYLVLQS